MRVRHVLALGSLIFLGCEMSTSPEATRFVLQDPYATGGGQWLKGNFHMHTRHSDGSADAAEEVRTYRYAGYQVLCITDHNQYGDQDGGIVPGWQADATLHDWNGDGKVHADHVFGSGVEAYVRDWNQPPPEWMHAGSVLRTPTSVTFRSCFRGWRRPSVATTSASSATRRAPSTLPTRTWASCSATAPPAASPS